MKIHVKYIFFLLILAYVVFITYENFQYRKVIYALSCIAQDKVLHATVTDTRGRPLAVFEIRR